MRRVGPSGGVLRAGRGILSAFGHLSALERDTFRLWNAGTPPRSPRGASPDSSYGGAFTAAHVLLSATAMSGDDSVWKEILDAYLEEFLDFFFPYIHRDIDWSRGYECLDQELEPILRDSPFRERRVDVLVKVFLGDGSETWLLIHIEVHGYYMADLGERVHICNHRIHERYGREVVSLVVLTDDRPSWRPSVHRSERWGFEHFLRFPVVKVLDFRERWSELEESPNPFALVVMTHLETQVAVTDADRLRAKVSLIRRLYGRGLGRNDIIQLFRFIDWLLVLPEEMEAETQRQIAELEGRTPMPYVTSIERLAKKEGKAEGKAEGRAEGKAEGKAEGRAEGMAEGLRVGLLEAIDLGLELRFGKEALHVLPRVRGIADLDRLRELKAALTRVSNLAEFESLLGRS